MYIYTKDTERNNSIYYRMGKHANQEVNINLGTGMFCVEAIIVYIIHTHT